MKVKETTSEERVQTEILWEDAKLQTLKIFTEIFVTFHIISSMYTNRTVLLNFKLIRGGEI